MVYNKKHMNNKFNHTPALLTHYLVHPEIDVRIDETFDNNFEIENDFTKYLKEN